MERKGTALAVLQVFCSSTSLILEMICPGFQTKAAVGAVEHI